MDLNPFFFQCPVGRMLGLPSAIWKESKRSHLANKFSMRISKIFLTVPFKTYQNNDLQLHFPCLTSPTLDAEQHLVARWALEGREPPPPPPTPRVDPVRVFPPAAVGPAALRSLRPLPPQPRPPCGPGAAAAPQLRAGRGSAGRAGPAHSAGSPGQRGGRLLLRGGELGALVWGAAARGGRREGGTRSRSAGSRLGAACSPGERTSGAGTKLRGARPGFGDPRPSSARFVSAWGSGGGQRGSSKGRRREIWFRPSSGAAIHL